VLAAQLGQQDGTGIVRLTNLSVIENEFYGTSPYVIDKLVVVSNS
jgi:hypothetical protein